VACTDTKIKRRVVGKGEGDVPTRFSLESTRDPKKGRLEDGKLRDIEQKLSLGD